MQNSLKFKIIFAPIFLAAVYREFFGGLDIASLGGLSISFFEIAILFLIYMFFCVGKKVKILACDFLILFPLVLYAFNSFRGAFYDSDGFMYSMKAGIYFYIVAAAGIFLRENMDAQNTLFCFIKYSALLLAIISILRSFFGADLLYYGFHDDDLGINDGNRSLTSAGAFLIGLSIICGVVFDGLKNKVTNTLFAFLFFGLVLSKQGTAIIASICALCFLIFSQALLKNSSLIFKIIFFIIFISFAVILLGQFFSFDFYRFFGDVNQREANLDLRKKIWDGFEYSYKTWDWFDKLFGFPVGVKPDVYVDWWGGVYWEHSYHSMYYGGVYMVGLFGLMSLAAYPFFVLAKILLAHSNYYAIKKFVAIFSLVVFAFVYSYGYELKAESGLLFALISIIEFWKFGGKNE